MTPRRKNIFVCGLVTVLVSIAVSACSSSSSTKAPSVDPLSIECVAASDSDLGAGEVCVDSGVRSSSLFSFANWGGRRYKADDFGFAEMIALYGESVVCKDSSAAKCDVTPKARLMRNVIDSMLQNGRCEGMTSLGALYMTSKGPDPSLFKVTNVQDLTPSSEDFANVVDYWWGTQFLSDVVKESNRARKSTVKDVLGRVISGLSQKEGVTVGLYTDAGAHSILPVAVTKTSDTEFWIHVWDSNTPRSLTRLKIDLAKDEWTYLGGRINTSSAPKKWSGGSGTIDAVSLVNRKGKPVLNIDDNQKGTATITTSSSSDRELMLALKTDDGKQIVASSTGTVGAIPGATVTPMRNGDTSQIVISLPSDIGGYTVDVSSTADTTASGTTLVTVDNGDARAMSISIPNKPGETTASVTSRPSSEQLTVLEAESDGQLNVSAASSNSLVSIPTKENESVAISLSAVNRTATSISLTAPNGATEEVSIPSTSGATAQDVVILRKEDGSLFTVSKNLAPVEVSENSLSILASASGDGQNGDVQTFEASAANAVQDVSVSMFTSNISDSSFDVRSRITSESDATSWMEFGPDENWSDVNRTQLEAVESGIGDELTVSLTKLQPGTTYRFRRAVKIGDAVTYSAYSTETTTGDQPDAFTSAVPSGSVKVSAALVASTATGGVISAKVSSPVAASASIEYAAVSSPSVVLSTTPQKVAKGQDVSSVLVMNGLSIGQTYRYRVVVKAGNAIGYSAVAEMTTGDTVAATRVSTLAIGATFSLAISGVSSNSAVATATITSGSGGRVLVEYNTGPKSASQRTKAVSFASGKNVKVLIPLAGLASGTRFSARLMVVSNNATLFGTYRTFTTLSDEAADTSGGRLSGVSVPSDLLLQDSASFQVAVKNNDAGSLYFEYGVDHPAGLTYRTRTTQTSSGESIVGPIDSDPVLRAGTPYRVRAVLVVGATSFRSAFTKFVTTGTLDVASYRASAPNLRRISDGVEVTWSIPVPDVPAIVTFKAIEGSTVLCTSEGTAFECDASIASTGTKSIVVATFINGVEVTRSTASTITIGGSPTVSSFTFVSATTSSLTFSFSFNPQGETVQYGVEIRTPQDQFVKADLAGQTSTAQSGAVHQVTGLSSVTSYKARLILAYGTLTVASSWITVTTN